MENKNFAALFCIDRNMRKLVCYLLALVLIAGMALVASESVYAEPDVYQVDFVTPDNVSPIAAQTVESGAFALHPGLADLPNPNPENYVAFVGWYDDLNAGGEPFDFIKTPITADLTLYAKYRTSFVVSYLNGYGDIFYTAEVKPGEVAPELTVAEMGMFSAPVGAYFDHWDLIGDDEEVIREFIPGSEIVYSDLLVRCATTTNRHYIFFHSEGEQVQFQVVDSGAFAVKPADPRRIGYTFDHWADSNGTAFDFETMPITDNLTLSAVWTPTIIQYQLVFWKEKPNVEGDPIVRDSDTGAPLTTQPNFEYQSSFSAYDYAGTSVQDIDIDALIASMEIEYPLYSTYTSGDYIATNGTLLGNGSTIINIYFKKIEYTLYFYIGNDYTLNSEFEKSASAYKMTVNGEEYGWTDYFNFSSSQAQGSIDPASEEALALINNGNHYSFTAKYEDDISAEWPRVANIVKSGRPAYTPIGFYTVFSTGDDTMGTPRMTFESELIPSTGATESIVMTRWLQTVYDKHVHYYFEEVDGDQGMALPSIILSDENIGKTYVEDLDAFSIVNAPTPNKQIEYKVIVGMTPVNTVAIHRNNPNTGDFLPGDVSPTQTKGVHYYLFYNRAYHAVGINTMGGSAPAYNDDVDYNAVAYGDSLDKYIPRSNPERIEDGVEYEFEGWFYDAEYYTPYSAGDIMGDHDVVLYAKWASKEFEVRLYDRLNATEPVQTLYVGLGGYIDESALIYQDNIVYEDGRFNGWKIYIGPGATAWFAFDMPLYQNVDLYADWLDVAYRVVYKNDDPEISGTLPIDPSGYINDTQARVLGNIGDGVGAPLARTVDEIFLGWQKDKDGIIYYRNNLIRMIEDVDLYPRFEQIVGAGMVTFHSNFGEDITVIQPVAKNQPFLLPDEMIFEPLTRPNFVLTGWRLNDEGALLAKYDTYNYGTENGIALYAVWEEGVQYSVRFNLNDRGKTDDPISYLVYKGHTLGEDGVEPPAVTADEYSKFIGWNPVFDPNTAVNEDITFVAQYEALPNLDPSLVGVTSYDGAYSGTPQSAIVKINGGVYNPATPVPGYTVSFSVDDGVTWAANNPAYTNVNKTLDNYKNPVKVKIKADGYAPIIIDSYVRISQASLKITAPSAAVKLGDGIPTDATWVASYEGFVNGETEAALSGSGQIDVAGFDKDIAATYTVTVSGYTSDNYDISYVEGELTVLEAEEVAVKFAPGTSGVFKVGDRTEYAVRVGQTMNEGGVTPPAVIADEYHKFVDWSPAYSDDTVVTGDVTYTAQYEALPELEPGVAVVTPYDGAYSGTPHSLIVVIEGETYNPAAPFPECTVSFSVDGGATWMVDNLPAYTNVDKTLVNYTNPVKVKIRVDGYAPLIIDSYVRISQASLNITAPSATVKPGDGIPTDATWVASYDGLVNGETEAALFGSGQIVVAGFDKDIAATYTVTVSGYTSDNYDISYVTGTLIVLEDDGATVRFVPGARAAFQEGAITEYTLTIGQTMSEGGVLPPVVIPDTGWKFVGWYPEFSEDIVAVRGGATYVAWCEPLVVNPPEPPYIFLNVSYYDGVYSGTPHSVVVEVDTDSDEELLLEYSTNGVDWSTEMPTFTNVNNANPIGMYVVWVRVSGGTYATVSTQSFVRISKAPLTVSAPSGVVDLGEGIPEGEAWQPSYNGFVNGEDADVLSGTALIEVPYFDANTLGTYEVKVSGLSSGNYEITYLDGELIVKEPAEAAVVFDLGEHGSSLDKISYAVVIGKTLAEGGVEPPEVTADEGWKFIGWEPSFNYTDIVDDDLTYEALYEELPPVYPGAEFEFIDYEGTYTGTEHSISVRVIGVIDGEYTIRYSKDNGDSWSFENPAFKDVKDSEDNRHNVLIELTMNGFVQIAEAYVKITKAPLEISAPSAVIYVGEDIPDDWSLSYEGFVNGEGKDDLILTGDEEITVENFDANTVHVYSVIPAGFASNNYDITYTPGTLEVIGLDTATATVKFESGANGTISGKAEYMVPVGQTMAEGGVTAPEAIADEGYYFTGWDPAFIGGAAVEENETYIYTAQFEPLRSWPDEDLVFSLTPYDGSYTGTGHSVIVAADTSGVDYELSYSTEILDWQSVNPAFKNVANNANDNINKVWVKLTAYGYAPITKESYVRITKAPLTISAPSASIKQGQLIPADWSLSYAGFVNGENADVLSGIAQIAVPSFDTNIVGTYQVIASGYSSDNYDIEYIEGSLSVLPEDATTTTVRFNAGEHGAIISGMAEYTASVGQTMAQNGVTPPQVKADAGYSFTGWAPAFRGSTMVNASGGYDYIAQYTKMPTIDYTDIKSYEGTYTGTGHSVHVNVQAVDIEYQVEYSVDGGATWTNENPVYKDVNIVDPDNKYRVLVKVTTDRNTVVTKAYYVRINPAPLTITAPSGEVELGEGIPVGEDWQLTYDGFVNGEGEADLTRTGDEKISVVDFDSDTAGSYVVEAGGFTSGNYRITYIDGLLIVNDSPYPGAEIIVSDYEGRYTGTEHSVSVEVIGVPDGEYTVRYSTDAGENWTLENPGFKNVKNGGEQYDVLVAVTINGVVHRIPAFVKITKAPLTIEVQDEEIELGGTIPSEWRFLYAGLVGGEEAEDAVSGTAVIDVVDFDANTAGSYQVNVSGFTSGNYAITYSSGNLIVKAPNEAVVKFDLGDYGDTLEETLYTVTVGRTMAQGGVSEPIVRVQNENYEFTGWEPAFSEDIVVSGDITFVAQYALLPALPNPNEIFSITSYNAAYDGDVHAVAVVFIDPDYDADDKVSYSTDGVNYSANNPAYKNVNNEADDNEYPVWVKINVDGYAPYIEKAYVKITKVQLTISAPSGEVDLGAGLPSDEDWKLTYDGFVNGEGRADLTPTGDEQIHVVGFDPETPGEYVVEAGGFTSGNYNITYVPGSLIVREDDTPTLPGAPRNVIASAFVNGAVVVFDPPASDGGSPILFYTVRCRVDDELISEVTTETLSSVYTALTEGVGYTFTVSATNAVGEGPESESSNVATPPGEPEDETLKFNEGIRLFMKYKETKKLNFTADVSSYRFVSSDDSMASVSATGNVTALRTGMVRIFLMATDGSGLISSVVISIAR
ncbi:MAG: InlB B-repeat-containing protein [Clostridiales Family XIII bacterium]|jgi:hypothetical protein|nr:InlB B-repeat-containing protein [Clostridiales Family XIII bacterium]